MGAMCVDWVWIVIAYGNVHVQYLSLEKGDEKLAQTECLLEFEFCGEMGLVKRGVYMGVYKYSPST